LFLKKKSGTKPQSVCNRICRLSKQKISRERKMLNGFALLKWEKWKESVKSEFSRIDKIGFSW
jgi:hypothetical protein